MAQPTAPNSNDLSAGLNAVADVATQLEGIQQTLNDIPRGLRFLILLPDGAYVPLVHISISALRIPDFLSLYVHTRIHQYMPRRRISSELFHISLHFFYKGSSSLAFPGTGFPGIPASAPPPPLRVSTSLTINLQDTHLSCNVTAATRGSRAADSRAPQVASTFTQKPIQLHLGFARMHPTFHLRRRNTIQQTLCHPPSAGQT